MFRPKPLCVADFKQLAKKRVPFLFMDYATAGSYEQITLDNNTADFLKLHLIQRGGMDVSKRTIESTAARELLLNGGSNSGGDNANSDHIRAVVKNARLPIALGPIGFLGMQRANGEIFAACAALRNNIPFTQSTMSICSIEHVSDALATVFPSASKNEKKGRSFPLWWFQLYYMKDRGFMKSLIQRAKDAGCGALTVTLDLQILSQRHQDIRNGLSAPPNLMRPSTALGIARPRCWPWCVSMLSAKSYIFGNIVGHVKGIEDVSSLSSWTSQQFDPSMSWKDVEWIRATMNEVGWSDAPLIVKGVLHPRDAVAAAETGIVDAIVVGNHGGRCLDSQHGAISNLYSVSQAVKEVYAKRQQQQQSSSETKKKKKAKMQIHFESGIRTGADIFKASMLGADVCWIGRSYVYALGSDQRPWLKFEHPSAVDDLIGMLAKELDVTTALCGVRNLQEERSVDYLDVRSDEVKKHFGLRK